nr:MAG TPA: hypothetical protein [Caudoviricetes sp.]
MYQSPCIIVQLFKKNPCHKGRNLRELFALIFEKW